MAMTKMKLTACVKSTLQHVVFANPLRDVADTLNCFVKTALVIIFTASFQIATRMNNRHKKSRRPAIRFLLWFFSGLVEAKL